VIAARVHSGLAVLCGRGGRYGRAADFSIHTSQPHRDRAGTICLYSGRTLARLLGTDRSI
jgi:hypothetical protein